MGYTPLHRNRGVVRITVNLCNLILSSWLNVKAVASDAWIVVVNLLGQETPKVLSFISYKFWIFWSCLQYSCNRKLRFRWLYTSSYFESLHTLYFRIWYCRRWSNSLRLACCFSYQYVLWVTLSYVAPVFSEAQNQFKDVQPQTSWASSQQRAEVFPILFVCYLFLPLSTCQLKPHHQSYFHQTLMTQLMKYKYPDEYMNKGMLPNETAVTAMWAEFKWARFIRILSLKCIKIAASYPCLNYKKNLINIRRILYIQRSLWLNNFTASFFIVHVSYPDWHWFEYL